MNSPGINSCLRKIVKSAFPVVLIIIFVLLSVTIMHNAHETYRSSGGMPNCNTGRLYVCSGIGSENEETADINHAGAGPACSDYHSAIHRYLKAPGFTYREMRTFDCNGLSYNLAVFVFNPYVKIVGDKDVAAEFILIPGGSFYMGCRPSDVSDLLGMGILNSTIESESPYHIVHVKPFLIARTETIQSIWDRIKDGKGPASTDERIFHGDRLPIQGVNWIDAQLFTRYSGLMLPSESEWEYACRGGRDSLWFFGEEVDDPSQYVRYNSNNPIDVGSKLSNAYGLLDMAGNVEEWVQDRWHSDYSQSPPSDGTHWETGRRRLRVIRGGCFCTNLEYGRSSARAGSIHSVRDGSIGFRASYSMD